VTASDVRRAAELIHEAMDADDAGHHERERGIVDTTSDELAAALLRAGWTPPTAAETRSDELDCGWSPNGVHERGTGRDRGECCYCDHPMPAAETGGEA
jgi:hypothetical protein